MKDIDLLSLVLTLRPLAAVPGADQAAGQPAAGSELNWLGRASHAVLLDAVRSSDKELAEALHAGDGLRPFTASNLIGHSRWRGLSPEQTYTLRFTALTRPVASALLAAARAGPLRAGASIDLDGAALRIEAVTESEIDNPQSAIGHPWAASTTYEALSAPWLLGRQKPERRLTLQFSSPTTFKKSEPQPSEEREARRPARHLPVPLPDLVFGSLLNRWNAFAPVAFPEEARRYAEECLALAAYRLRTHAVPVKAEGLRVGAVGQARYVALTYDRYWMSLIHLLADFAFFAGVGVGTTTGLGQCRRVAEFDAPGEGRDRDSREGGERK